MNTDTEQDFFEQWWAAMPESKLELIDGGLVIGTLTGSRRVMLELLKDYGPDLVLPMVPTEMWWAALREAYNPHPMPETATEWIAWADGLVYQPDVPLAGPQGSVKHRQMYDILMWGLNFFGQMTHLGRQLGRDFVIRLGENGLTPDVIFIDRDRLANLRERYLEGPPAIAIEIVLEGSETQDRELKRQLYEQASIPEYWLIEPEALKMTFYRLQTDGYYQALVFNTRDLQQMIRTNQEVIYHSEAVPGLSVSLLQLWTMEEHDWQAHWQPFLPVEKYPEELPRFKARDDEITWDSIPFAPRVDLQPVTVRFAEFASWCGRAKFERYGSGLKIDGTEGTHRVAGMLLMTFGLIEVVRLVHPREWVAFLERDQYEGTVQQQTEVLMRQAKYEHCKMNTLFYRGEVPDLPNLSGYGHTLEECQQDLTEAVKRRILLGIARRVGVG